MYRCKHFKLSEKMKAQKQNRKSENKSTALQMVVLNDHRFAVEEKNGNISFNLTMMSKPYGRKKRPGEWLKTESAREYLDALSVANIFATADNQNITNRSTKLHICTTADLVEVRQGGNPNEQGTWANHYLIAVEFARWLEPQFSIQVNQLVWNLLTKKTTLVEKFEGVSPLVDDNKAWYYYLDVLKAIGNSTTSGSVSARKRKYPQHFKKIFGRNFVTLDFCHYLKQAKEIKKLQTKLSSNQLALEL